MGKRAAAPTGRGRSQSRRRRRRSPLGRLVLPALALATLALGGGAALAHYNGAGDTGPSDADTKAAESLTPEPTTAAPTTPKATTPTPARTTAKPKPPPKPKPQPKVPESGPGTFESAGSSGAPVGTGGTLRRYRVQVEDGIDVSAAEAAAEIERILAHPRGWAAHGRGRFQLVTENADFVIRIATPTTADRLCLAVGLNTRGELNCETTQGVVVNLKRWLLGSPTFTGTPAEYRHLIINHEVGHEIGLRTHMTCPGAGKLAPVMMQQIKGLKGCRSNAYPYDEDGSYIEGPIVP